MAVLTRAEWQKMRDRNGVEAGRSKISIGKSLDAYHQARTPEEELKKLEILEDAFSAYPKALNMKDPGEMQLAREIGGLVLPKLRKAHDRLDDLIELKKTIADLTVGKLLEGKNSKLLDLFCTHCENEHNNENIEFVLAVKKGQKKQEVYKKYIDENGASCININAGNRNELEKLAKDNAFDKMNFGKALEEIVALLERDVIPRFIKNPKTAKYIEDQVGPG